jgi:hypothetical protein
MSHELWVGWVYENVATTKALTTGLGVKGGEKLYKFLNTKTTTSPKTAGETTLCSDQDWQDSSMESEKDQYKHVR